MYTYLLNDIVNNLCWGKRKRKVEIVENKIIGESQLWENYNFERWQFENGTQRHHIITNNNKKEKKTTTQKYWCALQK